MAQDFAHYTRGSRFDGTPGKKCGRCGAVVRMTVRRCVCGRSLRKRLRAPKKRDLDSREHQAGEALDRWLTKLVTAVGRIRYYRGRLRSLERERQAKAEGRVK